MPEQHVNRRRAILSTNVPLLSRRRMLYTVSFLILSRLDTRNSLFNEVISAVRILPLSSFLRHQHSEPYNSIGTTKVSHNTALALKNPYRNHTL